MSNHLHNTLRHALTTRGLLVEAIDQDLVTRTIDDLTPAQRWQICLRFGLTGLPPMNMEEFCKLVGDKNPASAEKIWKDGMNSLTFKIYMAIKVDEKPAPEPDPDDGQIRLDGKIATEEEVESLNTPCSSSHLSKWNKRALAEAGIPFFGDLVQRTTAQIRAIKEIGRKGLAGIEVDLAWKGLGLNTRVTGWKRPEIPE